MKIYKTYRFKKQDPAIAQFKVCMREEGMTSKEVAENSGLDIRTVKRWMSGETKAPMHKTITAALRTTANDFIIVRKN